LPGDDASASPASRARLESVRVDEDGIRVRSADVAVIDVQFDGRRIWSFWLPRDAVEDGDSYRVAWPRALRPFLDGVVTVTLREHVSAEVLFETEARFGTADTRVAVVDRRGLPLALDKSEHLMQTFDTRDEGQVRPLLEAIERVLAELRSAGIEAFLAYGTLLGAVREGRLIGHDSDADLGYVSRHEHPYDVVRESFALQRRLGRRGFSVTRYSGAAFKVEIQEADGSLRGIDVFGGFLADGFLHLMGEIRAPFDAAWMFPLGTSTLESRRFPVPARPERLLAVTYGDGWRVPDPAFRFDTPLATSRRLSGWFRGTRFRRLEWELWYDGLSDVPARPEASAFAKWVVDRDGLPDRVVDIGCGRGEDALWFAQQGVPALGLDYVPTAAASAARLAERCGWNARFSAFNLTELRSVLAGGAALARVPGPRAVLARQVVSATSRAGRHNLWRASRMMLRPGGRLYLELVTKRPRPRDDAITAGNLLRGVAVAVVAREVEERGGSVVAVETSADPAASEVPDGEIGRLVVEWR
jgi:SAM-dependent methyltransferase